MTNKYSFKVVGLERKTVAQIIAVATNHPVKYAGPPTFAYEVGEVLIDRGGMITIPFDETIAIILSALHENGTEPDGDAAITIAMGEHTGVSLRNLINLIYSKDELLRNSLGRDEPLLPFTLIELINSVKLEQVEDFKECIEGQDTGGIKFDFINNTLGFNFYKATLDIEQVKTHLAFSTLLEAQAIKQKHSSVQQKKKGNEKYAMRCWLLRLGMIGDDYKVERKILLEKLTGNCSFGTDEALQRAFAKRKTA